MNKEQVVTLEHEFLNSLDEEIRTGSLKLVDDTDSVYRLITNNFPLNLDHIDWEHIPGAIEEDFNNLQLANEADTLFNRTMRETLVFFARACDKYNLSGEMYFFNDGLDVVLSGAVVDMRNAIPKLYLENGHLYFLATDGSWCIQKSMSRHIRFGFSPHRNLRDV